MPNRQQNEPDFRQVPIEFDPREPGDNRKEALIIAAMTIAMIVIVAGFATWAAMS